jgi:hypothetical protein
MLELGWGSRPGVTILFGRWQDLLPELLRRRFDGIFFDTYGGPAHTCLHHMWLCLYLVSRISHGQLERQCVGI